jgi:hypothetical protein
MIVDFLIMIDLPVAKSSAQASCAQRGADELRTGYFNRNSIETDHLMMQTNNVIQTIRRMWRSRSSRNNKGPTLQMSQYARSMSGFDHCRSEAETLRNDDLR